MKNSFLLPDGFGRDVPLRAPVEWDPSSGRRIWKLNAPAYRVNDAPVAPHWSLGEYLLNSVDSLANVAMRCQVSPFAPCLFSFFVNWVERWAFLPLILMMFLGVGNLTFRPRFEISRSNVLEN